MKRIEFNAPFFLSRKTHTHTQKRSKCVIHRLTKWVGTICTQLKMFVMCRNSVHVWTKIGMCVLWQPKSCNVTSHKILYSYQKFWWYRGKRGCVSVIFYFWKIYVKKGFVSLLFVGWVKNHYQLIYATSCAGQKWLEFTQTVFFVVWLGTQCKKG